MSGGLAPDPPPQDIRWHFVGHLQSNKARPLLTGCPLLATVETVDSASLADRLCQGLPTRSNLQPARPPETPPPARGGERGCSKPSPPRRGFA